ncbi:MAG TPA: pYEATS domain-containing protein, partial [Gemmataceae bacterium]|nr:pYEATS domain-containing protein [Gemmataceae bacterium]
MSITVQQKAVCKGNSWWKWSVWLAGSKDELDEIEAVEYILHATFVHPVRLITNRKTKFRLDSAGWGEFTIYLNIKHKN